MAGNSFGTLFRFTSWGESHGPAVGAVVDGCPPRLPIEAAEIQAELDRRRPGQSDIVTPRKEEDRIEILSGLFEGRTTGTPISLLVRNADQRPVQSVPNSRSCLASVNNRPLRTAVCSAESNI